MTKRWAALGTVLAGALALAACDTLPGMGSAPAALDIPTVDAGDIAEATIKDVTRLLSSDEFEGRMPGTIGEEKTIALLTERFKAAGLKPGNGDTWVQEVPLVEITGKNYAPLAITGKGGNLSLDFAKDWVGVTYREEAKTTLKDSELVFVGYGINAPEKGWNDYAGLDVKGKTVVILVNDPDWQTEGLEGPFNGKAMTYYGRWTYKFEEAARQGAAGALIVHQTAPAAYGWNVVESSWTGPQAYAQRGENAPPLTQMNGWVTEDAARRMLKAAGQDLDALTKAAQMKGFKAVPLGMTASTSFESTFRSFKSHNIIGILPGSETPDEYVLHTAHWDHLGRCTPAADGGARRAVQWQGDDLLRALDLQVRRGCPAGGRRRADRPSDRARQLWLERGRKLVDRPAGLCPARGKCAPDDPDERLGDRGCCAQTADRRRAGSRCPD